MWEGSGCLGGGRVGGHTASPSSLRGPCARCAPAAFLTGRTWAPGIMAAGSDSEIEFRQMVRSGNPNYLEGKQRGDITN